MVFAVLYIRLNVNATFHNVSTLCATNIEAYDNAIFYSKGKKILGDG